jgi:hypothetical protein
LGYFSLGGGRRVKLVKVLEGSEGKIVIKERPIRPQLPGETLIKPKRVLLTPLDRLLVSGLINTYPPVLGSHAYGEILVQESVNEPQLVVVYPSSCKNFPVIKRDGFAAEITTVAKDDIVPAPRNLRYPEFYYIYSITLEAVYQSVGETLVIGENGLQTLLLASIADKNMVIATGENKLRGKTSARIVGDEKLRETSCDTIIVWSMDIERIEKILLDTESNKILVHPYTTCLNTTIYLPLEKHSIVKPVIHGKKDYEDNYGVLENVVSRSGFHMTISLYEMPPEIVKPYITVVL